VTLQRGFRTDAERLAAEVRRDLSLGPTDRIDLCEVASAHGVRIVAADELVPRKQLEELEAIQAFAFSACTFDLGKSKVVVVNPLRSEARQTSDIAHELSHLLLRHELSEIREIAGVPFRTCQPEQEEQATTLGGTLLLPRSLLLHAVARGLGVEDISHEYGVTLEMARFRYNTTGVAKQVQRARARREQGT
jgi:Zn-dependent peptidase ImmA (M78 family)